MKFRGLLVVFAASRLIFSSLIRSQNLTSTCRCLPSDPCWPSAQKWTSLNATVGGRLIATIPLSQPCHEPAYNITECAILKETWAYPQTHFVSPSSFVAPYFQNQSCDPFTPKSNPCTLGNYVNFAINISRTEDVVAGLRFAQDQNLRIVVKNTGHDLLGKCTGKGALGLWTHNLKSISVLNYTGQFYNGPAMKIGAGVQGFEAFNFAQLHNLSVIGGTCPTVGLAGGYTQGGGHGMLVSSHGLSADNTLEWEVVTAEGAIVTASPIENSDLYWALSGGGPGSYGVVVSLTMKAFQDEPIAGASLTITSIGISQDVYWDAVGFWHRFLPTIVDNQGTTNYLITGQDFNVTQVTFPGRSKSDAIVLLQPLLQGLKDRGIPYSSNFTYFPTYVQHYNYYIGLPYGNDPSNQVTGSRLIPRSVILNRTSEFTAALKSITSDPNYTIIGTGLNVTNKVTGNSPGFNSVLPAWRETLAHLVISGSWNYTASWNDNLQIENRMTSTMVPSLIDITPGSGTYMNEANFQQASWKQDFYGSNYPKLRAIKRKYDPRDLFYAVTAVGSDAWSVSDNGRICRVT